MHARSAESTPYDIARDDSKYPFERVFEAAEMASNLDPAAVSRLNKLLKDKDSAVRYWGVMGYLMRGAHAVNHGEKGLKKSLQDPSPFVRIAAAQALAQYGSDADLKSSLSVLEKLAHPDKNGILVSMAALTAIADLGEKAAPLGAMVSKINPVGPSPDERFNKYIPTRIIPRILESVKE